MPVLIIFFNMKKTQTEIVTNLIGIGDPGHARHYAEHVVIDGIHSYLSSGSTLYGTSRKDKLKNSVINSGEVA